MTPLDVKIESLLFWKAEPFKIKELSRILGAAENEIKEGLTTLEKKLGGRGVALIFKDDEVMLKTAPSVSSLIERLAKEELSKDLGKAGLETLSIVLYQGPISRREVDYIRGVNSTFIVRNLLVRGLIERVDNPKDQRSFLYRPTFETLSYLGISRIDDLPEYKKVREEVEAMKKSEGDLAGETISEDTKVGVMGNAKTSEGDNNSVSDYEVDGPGANGENTK